MNVRPIRRLLPLLVLLAACEDEKKPEQPPPRPEFAAPTALALTNDNRALWIDRTDSLESHDGLLARRAAYASTVIVREQTASEYNLRRSNNAPAARTERRVEDLYDGSAIAATIAAMPNTVFVLEPLRNDQSWLLDAERGTRQDDAARTQLLTFANADFRAAVTERAMNALSSFPAPPKAFVLGTEMERYLLANPADWPNFASYVHELRAAIKAQYPDMAFSVGINWTDFMNRIVPDYVVSPVYKYCEYDDDCIRVVGKETTCQADSTCTFKSPETDPEKWATKYADMACTADTDCANQAAAEGGDPTATYCASSGYCAPLDFVAVRNAWRHVLDPLYFVNPPQYHDQETAEASPPVPDVDFYAFTSIPDPTVYDNIATNIPDDHFAGIPTLFGTEPSRALPVRWVEIGWPQYDVSQASADFVERFTALNGGYNVQSVAWFGFVQLSNTDESTMTQRDATPTTYDIGAAPEFTHRGFSTYSGSPSIPLQKAFFGDSIN